nr:MAG: ribonucleoside-triphosphate reductase [Lokiarchaeota virus Skoll Meg22_1214]
MNNFKLRPSFINQFKDKSPNWTTLGYITYKRTYARWIESENRKEEFHETLQRVVEGCFSILKNYHQKNNLYWNEEENQILAEKMYVKMWNFKFLPPGRGLWMMGTRFIEEHGSMALNNCAFVSTKNLKTQPTRPFMFMMDALMLGVGVGFDTLGANSITIQQPRGSFTFKIPDSREGWVQALHLLLNAYFKGVSLPLFDYSLIREKGTPIKGFGGIASGKEPLQNLFNTLNSHLQQNINKTLSSLDILDFMNYIGKCVVAGNVRRSAQIVLFPSNDPHACTAKNDKQKLLSHRWAANHSIIAHENTNYSSYLKSIFSHGEPGFFWIDNARLYDRIPEPARFPNNIQGTNPCGEISLESGELCNLVEIFPPHHESLTELLNTLHLAYLYAKTVSLLPTHWNETNYITSKNKKLGISLSGITQAFKKFGRNTFLHHCDKLYMTLLQLDEQFSSQLHTTLSTKLTAIKPSGTISLLANTTPGIHYPISQYYLRRIRISNNSPLTKTLINHQYPHEPDPYNPHTTVFSFPCQTPHFLKSLNNATPLEQLQNAIDIQHYYVDNQVSITISFSQSHHDPQDLLPLLKLGQQHLKGLTLYPLNNNHYYLPPYQPIPKSQYQQIASSIIPLKNPHFSTSTQGELYCNSSHCQL